MSLDLPSLARVQGVPYAAGESKSLFLYMTDDTAAAINASGYFNGATKTLRKGDLILASCTISGTPTCRQLVVTSATAAATVTTAAAA